MLGKLATNTSQRDAIHIAIAPLKATGILYPGQHIKLSKKGEVEECDFLESIGIVDPFLKQPVRQGQFFWICLHPNTITSLRHDWTHPAFDDKAKHIEWLRDFAATNLSLTLETLLAVANAAIDQEWDEFCLPEVPSNYDAPPEFWEHLEIALGKKIPSSLKTDYFRCAC